MTFRTIALCSAALFCAPVASAQTPEPVMPLATSPLVGGASAGNVIRAGVKIPLRMAEALTTKGKHLKVGQRFNLEVAESVMLGDQVVIPVGSPATGEVTEVRNKGMWGKSGNINARVLFLRVNGRQVRMSGQIDDKGVTGTVGVVAAIAFIPIAGFFTTGTSAVIPLGAPVNGFLDEDIVVAFAEPVTTTPVITVPAVAAPVANTAAAPLSR